MAASSPSRTACRSRPVAMGTPTNFVILASCPARWHPDDAYWYERFEHGRLVRVYPRALYAGRNCIYLRLD
jgi:hypothetical protein